jgi:hypothetical protein
MSFAGGAAGSLPSREPLVLAVVSAVFLWGLASTPAASGQTPPPTNVKLVELRAINAKTGSFVLQWEPAMKAEGVPYDSYQLPAGKGCAYKSTQSGVSFRYAAST